MIISEKKLKALKNAEDDIKSLTARIDEMGKEKCIHRKDLDHKKYNYTFAEKPEFAEGLGKHPLSLGKDLTIVFDNVFTNDLGAYSPVTGVFTVPMNSTYFFTATVMSHYGKYLESEIALNGQSLVDMFSQDDVFRT